VRGSASSKLTDEELQPQGTPEGDEPQVLGPGATGGGRRVTGEVMTFTLRSSPYPTPEDLAAYERIHPGFTDRMLTLTERETDHRISQEHLQTRATIRLASRGQYMAFIGQRTAVRYWCPQRGEIRRNTLRLAVGCSRLFRQAGPQRDRSGGSCGPFGCPIRTLDVDPTNVIRSACRAPKWGVERLLGQLRAIQGASRTPGIAPVSSTSTFSAASDEFSK
jgi:hypothetical protein